MNKTITFTVLMAALLTQPLQAADIAGEVRNGEDGPDTSDGGFLEVGVGASLWNHPQVWNDHKGGYGLIVSGAYRYKGLFVEAINGTADGVNLGYQLWNDDQWAVDLIGINATNGRTNPIEPNLPETSRNLWLMDRQTALTGAGLRVTRYFDDYIFQFRVLNDIYNNRGNYGSARLGRSWQYRNWNFHAIGGIEYFDSQFGEHLVGVGADEATRAFPQYSPGSFAQVEGEVGVTYPMTEHWVFRATIRHTFLPDAVTNSPLYEDNYATSLFTSLNYVF